MACVNSEYSVSFSRHLVDVHNPKHTVLANIMAELAIVATPSLFIYVSRVQKGQHSTVDVPDHEPRC